MRSILQDKSDGCLICGSPYVEEHHVFYGTADRKLSEQYGLKVYLCHKHHRDSRAGVHFDPSFDKFLKRLAQEKFEETHSHEEFMRLFMRDYL